MTIQLNAKAILDSSEFQKGVEDMRSSGKSASGDIASSFSAMGLSSIAKFLSLSGAIAETVKILGDCTQAAAEDETIMTQLGVTLTDMGRTGDISASGLNKTAMNLQTIEGIDHDDILQAYNAIAKFENLDTTAMDQIVKDAIDMFAGGEGGSVAENANAIARVLETGVIPRTWGFSVALRAAIQDEVKAGDTTKALADTLGTLEQRFGGQAAAQMKTEAGQARLLAADFKTLEEEIGQKLLPTELKLVQFADLIITAHDKIDNALQAHSVDVLKTSKSYEDYALEMLRAKFVSQGVSEQDAITRAQHALSTYGLEGLAKAYNITSKEMYGYIQAAQGMDGPDDAFLRFQQNSKPDVDGNTQSIIDQTAALAQLADAARSSAGDFASFAQDEKDYFTTMDEHKAKIAALEEELKTAWGSNKESILSAIGDEKAAMAQLEKDHHDKIGWMIGDLINLKNTRDGDFSRADMAEYTNFLEQWGVITHNEALKMMDDWDAVEAAKLRALGGGASGGQVPTDTFTTTTPSQRIVGYNQYGPIYGATGLDIMIPEGYGNDKYPLNLNVSSGEEVIVKTPSQQNAGGGGGGGGLTLYNYGTLVVQGHEDVQESLLRQLR